MNCWHCNSDVIWQADFNFDDYNIEGEGIVTVMRCSNEECLAEYEIKVADDKYENR